MMALVSAAVGPMGFSCAVVTLGSGNLEVTLPTRQDANRRLVRSIYINICILYFFLYKVFLANIF